MFFFIDKAGNLVGILGGVLGSSKAPSTIDAQTNSSFREQLLAIPHAV